MRQKGIYYNTSILKSNGKYKITLDITKELSSKQHSEADILEVMIDSGL
jgi:hypothetical protein